MEKSNFWTRYEESKKIEPLPTDNQKKPTSLLANILNDDIHTSDSQSEHLNTCLGQYTVNSKISISDANESSGSIIEPNQTVDISVVNTDLFAAKKQAQHEAPLKENKKRRRRNNTKRIKRIEAMNNAYVHNNSIRNIKLPFL